MDQSHQQNEHAESLYLEELCYSVSDIISRGEVREIAHSINNLLTPLQIQYQLMSMGANGSFQKNLDALGRVVEKYKAFSSELMQRGELDNSGAAIHLQPVIEKLVKSLSKLESFSNLDVQYQNTGVPLQVCMTEEAIRFLLISFFHHVQNHYKESVVTVKTGGQENDDFAELILSAAGEPVDSVDKHGKKKSRFADLNIIPLRRMQRILLATFDDLDVIVEEDPELQVTCQIGVVRDEISQE